MKKKIEWEPQRLLLKHLKTHPSVQREFNMSHAREIALNWQSLVARPLIVVEMTSGDRGFYVIDGQHTRWAAEKAGEKVLECRVVRANTKAEMNEIFHLINSGVRQVTPIDSYGMNSRNDRTTADALSNKILAECNLAVGSSQSNHCIRAVQPLRKAFAQLGVEKFSTAAAIWELIADNGSKIKKETVTAIADIVSSDGEDVLYMEDLAALMQSSYPSIYARATMRCIGTSLSSAPHVLRAEIEDALAGSSVAA